MEILSAEFVVSNTKVEKCPQDNLPEYAFIGRSNVGKSSLINMLAKRPKLAMTSSSVNGKIVETVISDVMIDYHKNINYEKHSVRYHFCTMDKHTFDEFSERELEDMIHRGIVLYIE